MTTSDHQKYLSTSFDPDIPKFLLNLDELLILKKYGAWLTALEQGDISPNTEEQNRLVENSYFTDHEPQNVIEKVWFKYKDLRECIDNNDEYQNYELMDLLDEAIQYKSELADVDEVIETSNSEIKRLEADIKALNADLNNEINLRNLIEAAITKNGQQLQLVEQQIEIEENVTCSTCGGDGGIKNNCFKCDGKGWIRIVNTSSKLQCNITKLEK